MALAHDLIDDTCIIPGLKAQLDMLGGFDALAGPDPKGRYFSAPEIDLSLYSTIIVLFSGGKDSIAILLKLIEMGADLSKIELWHHSVDGDIDGSESTLMDWPFINSYCSKFAAAFGLPIHYSWLVGGIEGEMLKENSYSKPHRIQTPNGLITLERDTTRAKPATRLRFPQQSADLSVRWCSSSSKIDPGRRALNNQERFNDSNVLVVSGERREESSNRARYFQLEPHACDRRSGRLNRRVDSWRPALQMGEAEIWDILRRHRVIAPVPYRLNWSRSSCQCCVFNSPRIWATIRRYFPERAQRIAELEKRFDCTISRNRINVVDLATQSQAFEITDTEALAQAVETEYRLPVLLPEGQPWKMPAGAFGSEGCGAS